MFLSNSVFAALIPASPAPRIRTLVLFCFIGEDKDLSTRNRKLTSRMILNMMYILWMNKETNNQKWITSFWRLLNWRNILLSGKNVTCIFSASRGCLSVVYLVLYFAYKVSELYSGHFYTKIWYSFEVWKSLSVAFWLKFPTVGNKVYSRPSPAVWSEAWSRQLSGVAVCTSFLY